MGWRGKISTEENENRNRKGKFKRKIRETRREIRGNKKKVTRIRENGTMERVNEENGRKISDEEN